MSKPAILGKPKLSHSELLDFVVAKLQNEGFSVLQLNSGASVGTYTDNAGTTKSRFTRFYKFHLPHLPKPLTQGVLDLMLIHRSTAGYGYGIMFVEVKVGKDDFRESQLAFIAECGMDCYLADEKFYSQVMYGQKPLSALLDYHISPSLASERLRELQLKPKPLPLPRKRASNGATCNASHSGQSVRVRRSGRNVLPRFVTKP